MSLLQQLNIPYTTDAVSANIHELLPSSMHDPRVVQDIEQANEDAAQFLSRIQNKLTDECVLFIDDNACQTTLHIRNPKKLNKADVYVILQRDGMFSRLNVSESDCRLLCDRVRSGRVIVRTRCAALAMCGVVCLTVWGAFGSGAFDSR